MTSCEDFAEALSASLDDELDAGERDALAAHLATCPACRRVLSRYRAMDHALRDGPADLPAKLAEIAREHDHDASGAARRGDRSWRWRWSLSAAAALLLSAGLFALLSSRPARAWPMESAATVDVLMQEQVATQDALLRTLDLELRALRLEVLLLEEQDQDTRAVRQRIERALTDVQTALPYRLPENKR